MNDFILTTPVVFIIFNRPNKAQRVFDAIKRVRPEKLFIISDGPRNETERLNIGAMREMIDYGVDWPCQVFKKYADANLGCKVNIASGIDWVFQNVKEAIIVEDDCLPDQTFFRFCQELLEKYRNEPKIMQISGYNFSVLDKKFKCADSYYFSNIGSIWGWATWKRAWQYYDVNISNWPEIKSSGLLKNTLKNDAVVNHYNHLFDDYYAQKINSWDSQWFLTRWLHAGLSIVPSSNLIQNIGFDAEAAGHAIDPNDSRAHVPIKPMDFPLSYPNKIITNPKDDAYIFKYQFSINRSSSQKSLWFIKKRLPAVHRLLKIYKEKIKK